ncbi:hypothetical protein EVAR_662_1 [Eumeta japonica]|uniref:Uncharacterized protein n=1 Tax=Eumeta variegata TaxID=151549 RepID=A0A4C1SBP8_EUMVA|nr:hypothetical protein EVAR_662_1 [Eumeta japonica]
MRLKGTHVKSKDVSQAELSTWGKFYPFHFAKTRYEQKVVSRLSSRWISPRPLNAKSYSRWQLITGENRPTTNLLTPVITFQKQEARPAFWAGAYARPPASAPGKRENDNTHPLNHTISVECKAFEIPVYLRLPPGSHQYHSIRISTTSGTTYVLEWSDDGGRAEKRAAESAYCNLS